MTNKEINNALKELELLIDQVIQNLKNDSDIHRHLKTVDNLACDFGEIGDSVSMFNHLKNEMLELFIEESEQFIAFSEVCTDLVDCFYEYYQDSSDKRQEELDYYKEIIDKVHDFYVDFKEGLEQVEDQFIGLKNDLEEFLN